MGRAAGWGSRTAKARPARLRNSSLTRLCGSVLIWNYVLSGFLTMQAITWGVKSQENFNLWAMFGF